VWAKTQKWLPKLQVSLLVWAATAADARVAKSQVLSAPKEKEITGHYALLTHSIPLNCVSNMT